jgi:ActR/RegA family two-component response regulator
MQARVQVVLIGDLDTIAAFLKTVPVGIDTATTPDLVPEGNLRIGELVESFLAEKRLTMAQFARKLGCHRSTVGRIISRNDCRRVVATAIRTYIKEHRNA